MTPAEEHYLYDFQNICDSMACGLVNMSDNDDRDDLLIEYLKKDLLELNNFIAARILEYEKDAKAFKAYDY